ncbi:hypothetical protein K470DRAFT_292863 [Piedraia hortae CBS 480.64]|uniref:Transmembrane protein n=1 Tax=Piedraia hortae CBS 480.64 TaxID=1314780 RepID=A0A6A7C7C0_9PEZI|nr:hypothetical protein K470DRAFT_292863 [Piedraia hortae CBS 480.64]
MVFPSPSNSIRKVSSDVAAAVAAKFGVAIAAPYPPRAPTSITEAHTQPPPAYTSQETLPAYSQGPAIDEVERGARNANMRTPCTWLNTRRPHKIIAIVSLCFMVFIIPVVCKVIPKIRQRNATHGD